MAGKKKVEIDYSKLDGLLVFDASVYVCADQLGISHDTLERRLQKERGLTFVEYKERIVDRTVLKLKHKMITKALQGDNTCMIFALKNLSNWADKVDHGFQKDKQSIILKYHLEDTKKKLVQDEPKSED